jgi:hypothetical protein
MCGEDSWVGCRVAPSLFTGCIIAASFYNKVAPSTLDRLPRAQRQTMEKAHPTATTARSPSRLDLLSAARTLHGQR